MPTSILPNKEELTAIRAALTDGKADVDRALPAAIAAFGEGKFGLETLDSFVVVLKTEKPELWAPVVTADKPDVAAEREALADKAFLNRSASARGKLVKLLGEPAANALSLTYGLRSVGDFSTVASKPGAADDKDKPKNKSTNAWADDSPAGEARRIECIKMLGTKVSGELARAAGKTITGAPLRKVG